MEHFIFIKNELAQNPFKGSYLVLDKKNHSYVNILMPPLTYYLSKIWKNLFSSFVILLFLGACQGSPLKDFSSLKMGMEKNEILEIMGSPSRTQRFHGKDRWTYIFYETETRYEKEVHLDEGKAVYIGDIWNPPVENSAESVDTTHESQNKAYIESIELQSKENKSKSFSDYVLRTKGEDKIRYLPTFKQIK